MNQRLFREIRKLIDFVCLVVLAAPGCVGSADPEAPQGFDPTTGAADGWWNDGDAAQSLPREDMWYAVTPDSLAAASAHVEAHERSVRESPSLRESYGPYHTFHDAGEHVRGTVILFHGFSSRPHQMSMLASYLYENGYNVYVPSLAGQSFQPPRETWVRTEMRDGAREQVVAFLEERGVGAIIRNEVEVGFGELRTVDEAIRALPRDAQIEGWEGTVDLREAVELADTIAELRDIGSNGSLFGRQPVSIDEARARLADLEAEFERYHVSNHEMYIHDALERLHEVSMMRGAPTTIEGPEQDIPIFVIGLSVGGTVALRLAEEHPDIVDGVVAYAPLLRQRSQFPFVAADVGFVNKVGPLGTYFFGFDEHTQFPLGCFTAVNRFGAITTGLARAMQSVPMFLVSTENEDAAANEFHSGFYEDLGGNGNPRSFHFTYPEEARVPHPLVHPDQVSQGMQNRFWRSLYRETLRFLVRGQTVENHLTREEPPPESELDEALQIPGPNAEVYPEHNGGPF